MSIGVPVAAADQDGGESPSLHEAAIRQGTVVLLEHDLDDLASLHQALLQLTSVFHERPIFRGHGLLTWALRPEVFRSSYNESGLLWEFVTKGASRIDRPPSHDDRVGWIGLAQHFGLPTRLLDWTMSPLIALYFAIGNRLHDADDGCLWVLAWNVLNQQMFGHGSLVAPGSPLHQDFVDEAFGIQPVGGDAAQAFAVGVRENDVRMLVQQALFTIHRDDTDLAAVRCESPHLCRLRIPAAQKRRLRTELSAYGVTGASVFPDLEHLAADLKAKQLRQF